jgi:hypothetical protein
MAQAMDEIWNEVSQDPKLIIYSMQDAAASPRLYPNLMLVQTDHACLFRGELPSPIAETAPYLVRLRAGSPYARWLLRESQGQSWGWFCASPAGIMELCEHFRRLLIAQKENGAKVQFRFYDPRILSAYLPTCTGKELKQVFGPVRKFWVEDGRDLIEFSLQGQALRQRHIAMAAVTAAASPAAAREAMPA